MNRNDIVARIGAASLAALALGCGSSGSSSGYVPKKAAPLKSAMVPAGEEATYFPFAVGNQWTFSVESTQLMNGRSSLPAKGEITYKITQVAPGPDGSSDATFDVLREEKVVEKQVWRVMKNGLYQVAIGKNASRFSSPQLVMPFPPKKGDTFKWKGTVASDQGEVRALTNDGLVDGEEPIDTDMGQRLNALAIESKGTVKGAKVDQDIAAKIFMVPGVGIARYRQEIVGSQKVTDAKGKTQLVKFGAVQVMKLKSFSLKK